MVYQTLSRVTQINKAQWGTVSLGLDPALHRVYN